MSDQVKKIKFMDQYIEVIILNNSTKLFNTYDVPEEISNFLDSKIKNNNDSFIIRGKPIDESILDFFGDYSAEESDLAGRGPGQVVFEGARFDITDEMQKYLESIGFKIFDNHSKGPVFFYPPKSGYMGWHTNCKQSRATHRAFFTKGSGYFQYLEGDIIYRSQDSNNWKCNIFIIGDCDNPTWHSIWGGDSGRHSVGFMVEKI